MTPKVPFDVVIPARFASARFPAKLLADICGKTMIQRVVECAMSSSAEQVIVAVDDERIADNVRLTTSATVIATSEDHASGTDRIAEAVQKMKLPGERMIVNVQGDEPLMPGELIDQVVTVLQTDSQAVIGTAAVPMNLDIHGNDPNRVKCIIDRHNRALYFSRSVIPYRTKTNQENARTGLHHIGIYAYTVDYLVHKHASRDVCPVEKEEGLEQLRALYHGDTIAVHIDENYRGIGVDTQDDLDLVRSIIETEHF